MTWTAQSGSARTLVIAAVMASTPAGCLEGRSTSEKDSASDNVQIDERETSGDGCGQDLSSLVEWHAPACGGEPPPEHCTITGCGPCQVCLFDVVCGPPPWDDIGRDCECCGSGECADLCLNDSDCAEGTSCRQVGWFGGYDVYNAMLWVCWPTDASWMSVCP